MLELFENSLQQLKEIWENTKYNNKYFIVDSIKPWDEEDLNIDYEN